MQKSTQELLEVLSKSKKIEEYIVENNSEFINIPLCKYIDNIIKEKKLKKPDIINKSNINVQYAYQIFGGKKMPSRTKVLQLIFGMELDLTTANRILRIAGFSELYSRNQRDSIIIYAINNNLSLIECNEILYDLGEDILE